MDMSLKELAGKLVPVAQKAGCAEMSIYRSDFDVSIKDDQSPVTKADRLAEEIILAALAEIAPDIPVISEEAAAEGRIPAFDDLFFLVDPLDGTKQFISKNGEFTVNIALIERGRPIFGLIYAPALQELYLTPARGEAAMAHLDPCGSDVELHNLVLTPLATREPSLDGISVVASRSHMTTETSAYIERFSVSGLKHTGSSIKFCLIARGEADLYPRFGPTMEWDTAAGHAVLTAAGGVVVTASGGELRYGQSPTNLRNPSFIAAGRSSLFVPAEGGDDFSRTEADTANR